MFNREKRRQKKLYREKLNSFEEDFRKNMLNVNWIGVDKTANRDILSLEATAIMMDEAATLSRLTRWLIVLSSILSVLTFVLAYPLIVGVLSGLK
jgi:hypothetical protein